MKPNDIMRAWHDCLEAFGECLALIHEEEAKEIIYKYDEELLEEMLDRINFDLAILYPSINPFRQAEIKERIKRLKGFGKTNAVLEQEIAESAALLLFHALLAKGYSLKTMTKTDEGMLLELVENWA